MIFIYIFSKIKNYELSLLRKGKRLFLSSTFNKLFTLQKWNNLFTSRFSCPLQNRWSSSHSEKGKAIFFIFCRDIKTFFFQFSMSIIYFTRIQTSPKIRTRGFCFLIQIYTLNKLSILDYFQSLSHWFWKIVKCHFEESHPKNFDSNQLFVRFSRSNKFYSFEEFNSDFEAQVQFWSNI